HAFPCVYLLQLTHRNPEALRDVVAHLGSYLFHELTTPLGARLDSDRHLPVPPGCTNFRSFGTYAVWFPRGLLLRLAGRRACAQLLAEWQNTGEPDALTEIEAACARVLADPGLRPEALELAIVGAAGTAMGGSLAEALTGVLAKLEEQSQQT